MKTKKIYEYKIASTYGDSPTFQMKCNVYDVEEIKKEYEEKWFYGTRSDGFSKSICEVSSLDSNIVKGDGIMFYSEIQENEKEIINELLKREKDKLDSKRKNDLKWDDYILKRIKYIESKTCFEKC